MRLSPFSLLLSPFILLTLALPLYAQSSAPAKDLLPLLTQSIPADNPNLVFGGRWDRTDPKTPRCEWSGCALTVRFSGTALAVKSELRPTVMWDVDVDGQNQGQLAVGQDGIALAAANLPAGEHTVTIAKRTEPTFGAGTISAVLLEKDAKLLPAPTPAHRIEVIGDSISCGYGNEAKSILEGFTAKTENAWQAYGALVAKRFNAEYVCVAWSGKKMWPDNTLPDIYDLTFPTNARGPKFDDTTKPADVILINLSTNDFAKENPDDEGWIRGYKNFLLKLIKLHPRARIYLLTSPMVSDLNGGERKPFTTIRAHLDRIMKDLNNLDENAPIRCIEIPTQDWHYGYGADYHPSLATHWVMAQQIVARIEKDLKWKPLPATTMPAVNKRPKLPEEETPADQYIAFDGETRANGTSWAAPAAETIWLKMNADDAHAGKQSLHFHAEGGGYTGFGWNFFSYWPQDAGVDTTVYKNLVFWVKVKAASGQGPNLLNCQLNCSTTKKPSANVQIPKYCKSYDDGEWHEVIIPLADLPKKGFDPKTVWEIDIGQWAPDERSFDVFVDDIHFTNPDAPATTSAPAK